MIRKCTSKDLERMLEIINDAAAVYKGVIPSECWKEPYMPADELWHEICEGVVFWGFEQGGELKGVMGIQELEKVTLIRHAYVAGSEQGKGVGGRLLKHLLKRARNQVLVGTWEAAHWAVAFYRKHGFVIKEKEETARLLQAYWKIIPSHAAASVVLSLERRGK
ncbi:MAG: GNAT family N-acetyltransferase [Deltaproteobacteria bacterium]